MTIKFYSRSSGGYEAFSNFARYGFRVDGQYYETNEHFFQSKKFEGTAHETAVAAAPGPGTAQRWGKDRSRPLRSDWEQVKHDVMLTGLRAKFTQNPQLLKLLLSTSSEELIEDSPVDYYWGCGKSGSGKNMLGKLLMQLREQLRVEGVIS